MQIMSSDEPITTTECEIDDGELPDTPPQENRESTPILPDADQQKGIEEDYGDFVVDRNESIDMTRKGESAEKREELDTDTTQSTCESSSSSQWVDSILSCVLTPEIRENKEVMKRKEKPKLNCWNCGGEHNLTNCTERRDNQKIQAARKSFLEYKEGKNNVSRYHSTDDLSGTKKKFQPGRISDELRRALGIDYNDLPEWIYRMRKMGFVKGYPPAYLKQAIVKDTTNQVLRFHSDDVAMDDSDGPRPDSPPPKIEARQVVYYMGFNNTHRGMRDREANFRIPSFDTYVEILEEEIGKIHKKEKSNRKRKHENGDGSGLKRKNSRKSFDDDDDIQILPPPIAPILIDDDDSDCIVLDTTDDQSQSTPGSPDALSLQLEAEITSPKGASIGSLPGTPVLIRKNAGDGSTVRIEKPDLSKFRDGIVPFTAQEEPTLQKGFFKKMMTTIRSKLTGK